jgi:hypothetical protein
MFGSSGDAWGDVATGDLGFLSPGAFNSQAGPSAPTLQQLLPYYTMRNVPAPPANQVPVPRGVLTGYSNNHGPMWLASSYGPPGGFGQEHMPRGVGQGFGPGADGLPFAQRGPGVWQPGEGEQSGWAGPMGRPSMAPVAFNAGFGPGQGLSTYGHGLSGYGSIGSMLSGTALQVGPLRISWLVALLAIAGVIAYTRVPAIKKLVNKTTKGVRTTGAGVLASLMGKKKVAKSKTAKSAKKK